MNKVTRYRGIEKQKVAKEVGYIYSNDNGLVLIDQNKKENTIYNSSKIEANQLELQARLKIIEQKLNDLKKTNTETVDISSATTMNDSTKDFIVTGDSTTNSSVVAKSFELKNSTINVPANTDLTSTGNNAVLLNVKDDVELKNSTVEMNKATSSNCVKVVNANSLIIKDMEFTGTTYNTIMTGQNCTEGFLKNVLIDNCKFNEDCKHINIWFAGHEDDAVLTISNCYFKTSEQFLCISDYANANNKLTVNIINCVIDNYDNSYINNYGYNYAGFMFLQARNQTDYNTFLTNNPHGNGKVIININNLTVKGQKITKENFNIANGQQNQSVYYYCTKYAENNGCIKYTEETKNLFPIFNIQ